MLYDVVIIGGGLGGLLCGALLSKEGMRVCIIEKNNKLGGSLQTFVRDGVVFDTGVHYIGSLDPGQSLYQIFKYLGIIDDLKIERLESKGFDRISFNNDLTSYNYAQGFKEFEGQMASYFPDQGKAIHTYVLKLREVAASFPLYNLSEHKNEVVYSHYHEIDAKGFLNSLTKNKKLQNVLAGSNILYAGHSRTPLYTHAVIMHSYISSSWRCKKGGSQIANLLYKKITDNGGDFYLSAEASKFELVDEAVSCIKTKDGNVIYGRKFISDIHPELTVNMFEKGSLRKAYTDRIFNHENSTSAFIVNIVLKENSVQNFKCNFYHHKSDSVWNEQDYSEKSWPEMVGVFPSHSSNEKGFLKGITLITYMRFSDVKKWEHTINNSGNINSRGIEYDEFKRLHAEKLIDLAEAVIPGLRSKIRSYYSSSPLTIRDYIGSPYGAFYGFTKDYSNPLKSIIGPRTKIPNFYFTGQNLNLHGVLGVSLSAISTTAEICGMEYLIKKINSA